MYNYDVYRRRYNFGKNRNTRGYGAGLGGYCNVHYNYGYGPGGLISSLDSYRDGPNEHMNELNGLRMVLVICNIFGSFGGYNDRNSQSTD